MAINWFPGHMVVAQKKAAEALADIDGLVVGEPKDYTPINDAAKAANIDIGVVLNTPTPRPAATAAATKAP